MQYRWTRFVLLLACLALLWPPAARTAEQEATTTSIEVLRQVKEQQRQLQMSGGLRHIRTARERIAAWKKSGAKKPPAPQANRSRPAREYDSRGLLAATAAARAARAALLDSERLTSVTALGANTLVCDTLGDAIGSPGDLDDPPIGQSETSVAALGTNILVAWNDGLGFAGGPDLMGYGYSTDGGLTFTDGGVMPKPAGTVWTSDPVVTLNEKTGDFYFVGLIETFTTNGLGVVPARFTGGTLQWGTPHIIRSVNSATDFIDKPWVVADSSSGRLYVSYTHFTSVTDTIIFQRSLPIGATDYYRHWGPMLQMSPPSPIARAQGSRPAVSGAGEVYVSWGETGSVDADLLRIRKSTDQGASFGPVQNIASFFDNFGTGAPGFNRTRSISFPSIAIDRGTGSSRGRIYVAWNESVNWFDQLGATGGGGTVTESENNDFFAAADPFVIGQTVSGAFDDNQDIDIFRFAAVQGTTYIFWADNVPSSLYSMRVICSDSTNRLTFAGDGTSPAGGQGFSVWTAPATGFYYLRMFFDNRAGSSLGPWRVRTGVDIRGSARARDQRDIFVTSSTDGSSWTAPVMVNDDVPLYDNWLPEIAVSGDGRLFVFWFDWRDSQASTCGAESQIYLSRSDNLGNTWTNLGRITDAASPWGDPNRSASNISPNQGDYLALFANHEMLIPCWADGRSGNPDVYVSPLHLALTAVLASLVIAEAESDHVTLVWDVSSPDVTHAIVYRREASGWRALATMLPDGSRRVRYEDRDVTPGASYTYRLGLIAGDAEHYAAEVTVQVPVVATFGLEGARPNPAERDLWVSFVLPNASPGTLSLVDVTGRVARAMNVGSLGPGRHLVNLGNGQRFTPGVYLVRLVQGARVATRRVVVLK